MKSRRRTIDRATIEFANGSHLHRIAKMRALLAKIDTDPDRKHRLSAGLCPMCCYGPSRIGGTTTTSVQCAFCDTTMRYGNTAVGVCCMACATKAGICCDCGADLDWKNRRKRELPAVMPTINNN